VQWKRSKINCETIAAVFYEFSRVTRTQRRIKRKLISNSAFKFQVVWMQSVTTMTTITMTIAECQSVKSGSSEESGGSDKQAEEECQLLCLMRQHQVLKLSRRHFCFYKINDTSLKRLEYLESELSIHWLHLTNRGEITLDYCKNYHFRYKCICNYMCCVWLFKWSDILQHTHVIFFPDPLTEEWTQNDLGSENVVLVYF